MTSQINYSGSKQTFKAFIENGEIMELLLSDPKRRKALQENTRLYRIVDAYIPFFKLESRLSVISKYLEVQNHKLEELENKKRLVEVENDEDPFIKEAIEKIEYIHRRQKKIESDFANTIEQMKETQFFRMLKLYCRLNSITETGEDIDSEEEITSQALQQIIEMLSYVPENQAIGL
jgi:hypothetical protein